MKHTLSIVGCDNVTANLCDHNKDDRRGLLCQFVFLARCFLMSDSYMFTPGSAQWPSAFSQAILGVFLDSPPPRPPRPQSISISATSASEDEFGTPVTPNVRLPSVIVTPCTPSTKTCNDLHELDSDEKGISQAQMLIAASLPST
jgi:hypothetical protein